MNKLKTISFPCDIPLDRLGEARYISKIYGRRKLEWSRVDNESTGDLYMLYVNDI
jgi:hypothetical protein